MSAGQAWRGILTPEQAEVVEFIAAGRTNLEIAGSMFISLSTVKYRINGAMDALKKRGSLECRTRTALAMWWMSEVVRPTATARSYSDRIDRVSHPRNTGAAARIIGTDLLPSIIGDVIKIDDSFVKPDELYDTQHGYSDLGVAFGAIQYEFQEGLDIRLTMDIRPEPVTRDLRRYRNLVVFWKKDRGPIQGVLFVNARVVGWSQDFAHSGHQPKRIEWAYFESQELK